MASNQENENENISDISLTKITDSDSEQANEIENINYQIDDMISKLRKYFDENSDSVLPTEPIHLRGLLESLTSQVKSLTETYAQNLQSMTSINKRLKFQAKDYYDRYKELKATYDKELKEFQAKNKLIACEKKMNSDENEKIKKDIEAVKNEIDFFQKKIGISPSGEKDDETTVMIDILKSLKEKGVDVYEGLTKEQVDFVNEIINDEQEELDEDLDGERYAKAIEVVANKIYNKNLISDVKIEQIEPNVYAFNGKEIVLMFDESGKLKLTNGVELETWLVDTFKIAPTTQIQTMKQKDKTGAPKKAPMKKNKK